MSPAWILLYVGPMPVALSAYVYWASRTREEGFEWDNNDIGGVLSWSLAWPVALLILAFIFLPASLGKRARAHVAAGLLTCTSCGWAPCCKRFKAERCPGCDHRPCPKCGQSIARKGPTR